MEKPGEAMRGGAGTVEVEKSDRRGAEAAPFGDGGPAGFPAGPGRPTRPMRVLRTGTGAGVVLCMATALVHVLLVFLHVAPPNPLSQQYSRQINAWVFPLFEQNWRLFAPDPESVNRQILARTAHTAPDGTVRVSGWFDLTAVDNSAVRHNVFPSHSAQNTLRRAWNSYLETHGDDDRPRSERALMMRRYLTNIAARRVATQRDEVFESVQLRVITRPIAAADGSGSAAAAPTAAETRYLPWWKVDSDGN
ncbi:hypothetical protein QF026_001398 [Streptomyces aurantiacus]|uniref:DUF5819 family protein n=1 Tax=Streptomyces aurantiacus TaxID=47760 RepID=UPI0027916FFC|nr:DUF5819 family protein [Streptomyces aurantiacus]MDQ0772932.1 hypothetical protein [Streptomyces aurantiacus]